MYGLVAPEILSIIEVLAAFMVFSYHDGYQNAYNIYKVYNIYPNMALLKAHVKLPRTKHSFGPIIGIYKLKNDYSTDEILSIENMKNHRKGIYGGTR